MKPGPQDMMVPDDDNHSGIIGKHAERYLTFRPYFKRRGVAVDAGAHVGYWTRRMLQDFERVWAFEPHADNFRCLAANLKGTPILIPAALGAETDICVIRDGRPGNTGARHAILKMGSCPVVPLDRFKLGGCLDLLKIDVEGMELDVLQGARETIQRDWPVIVIELNKAASANYGGDNNAPRLLLEEWGYEHTARSGPDHVYTCEAGYNEY